MDRRKKTEKAFTDAYHRVLAEEGYAAIGVNKVAQEADKHKEFYYRYYDGRIEVLTLRHAEENDYWLNCLQGIDTEKLSGPEKADRLQEVIIAVLQNQLIDYYEDAALREMIAHSMDKKLEPVQREISDRRDAEGERLLKHSDVLFGQYARHFRAMMGVLVGGTDYVALHARNNRTEICGLDPNVQVHDLFLKMIGQVVIRTFQKLGQA